MNDSIKNGLPRPLGVSQNPAGLNIAVLAPNAAAIYFCVFDEHDHETARIRLPRRSGDVHHGLIENISVPAEGLRYGLRAAGEYNPRRGQFYDEHKLLVDPYATEIDRGFVFDDLLAAPASEQLDTAHLVPKSIFRADVFVADVSPRSTVIAHAPQFIYELSVKAYTQLHPEVPAELRGTVAALREPAVIEHLLKLGVDTLELMPIAAWVNERHLHRLGLHNAWGYNPVSMMALDPRLCPNGLHELRATVDALRAAGIQTILDVVFNHTGEGDVFGPTLSLRGLDNLYYYKHDDDFQLMNDTGCGNTIACERAGVAQLMMDTMRHWITNAGVAGFRFDLAPVMGRLPTGFSTDAPLLAAMRQDPLISQALLIAEPWDIGVGGYQLGNFQSPWLEWNDKYRDDVRRFWQGQAHVLGGLATRVAGSSDVFARSNRAPSTSVNFLAAHDGFTLRDVVSYSHKYNGNNGEDNRDGSNDNHSWSNGVEGELPNETSAADVTALKEKRTRDIRALLATLFVSQGTVMLTAGDEFGRTQHGNNNAYAQDNAVTWVDWADKDEDLIACVGALSQIRRGHLAFHFDDFLKGGADTVAAAHDVQWWRTDGVPMQVADWESGSQAVGLSLHPRSTSLALDSSDVLMWFNAGQDGLVIEPPHDHVAGAAQVWQKIFDSNNAINAEPTSASWVVAARSVVIWRASRA
ncbi:MAG: glycogen debranching protein GlgX [Formosimonas sp.]